MLSMKDIIRKSPVKKGSMNSQTMKEANRGIKKIVTWILGLFFIVIGIMNAYLIYWVFGLFYLILGVLYLLPTYSFIRTQFGFNIHFGFRLGFALVIIWMTLAVGDLAEMFGL